MWPGQYPNQPQNGYSAYQPQYGPPAAYPQAYPTTNYNGPPPMQYAPHPHTQTYGGGFSGPPGQAPPQASWGAPGPPQQSWGVPGPPQQSWGAPPPPPPGAFAPPAAALGNLPCYLHAPVFPPHAPIPPSLPHFEPSRALEEVLGATAGLGTRESKLIKALTPLGPLELAVLGHAYRARKGKHLADMLVSETSGYFGLGVEGLAYGPVAWDAVLVRRACRGAGTDERLLTELLLGRDPTELELLKAAWAGMYRSRLEDVVLGDLSMKTKRMFDIALLGRQELWQPHEVQRVDADAKRLKDAMKTGRTDELAVCSIILGRSREYLHALVEGYRRVSGGTTLTKSIKKHFSGHMEAGLLFVVEGAKRDATGAWRDAKRLEAAMKGLGTKDEQLVQRIVRMHWSPQHRDAVKQAYRSKYRKELLVRVRGETGGDYRELMCALIG